MKAAEPLAFFAARLAASAVFGAFRGADLVGVAGFFVQPGPKHAHKGMLWGMYVRPQARGAGIGRDAGRGGHRACPPSRRAAPADGGQRECRRAGFISELGFVEYGLEKRAAKYRGRYHDDVLMAKC